MKKIFYLFAIIVGFSLVSCEIEEVEPEGNEISDTPLTVSIDGTEVAVVKVVCRKVEFLNKTGFMFYALTEDVLISVETTDYQFSIKSAAKFFIETSTELEVKKYSGLGPYIDNSSFMGCDIEILKINGTTIEAKVSGGDTANNGKYVRGKFEATICPSEAI